MGFKEVLSTTIHCGDISPAEMERIILAKHNQIVGNNQSVTAVYEQWIKSQDVYPSYKQKATAWQAMNQAYNLAKPRWRPMDEFNPEPYRYVLVRVDGRPYRAVFRDLSRATNSPQRLGWDVPGFGEYTPDAWMELPE